MPPAARITDMHVCPMVTPGVPPIPHVGGPILPPGVPTVLIGFLPAATVTGMAVCVGPPDVIAKGSTGVFINFLPAARMGDTCAHGGTIVLGEPTVMIGEVGSPSPGAGGAGAVMAGLVVAGIVNPANAGSYTATLNTAGVKGSNPPYEPAQWNKPGVQDKTNCYAYAANDPSHPGSPSGTKPQPGEHCGHPAPSPSCGDVTTAATCDGMTPAPNPPPPKPGYYVVALVSTGTDASVPIPDYHWYRQDDNGMWSNKHGLGPVENTDASGNPITDPEHSDRNFPGLNYKNFCGYFYVPAGGVRTGPP